MFSFICRFVLFQSMHCMLSVCVEGVFLHPSINPMWFISGFKMKIKLRRPLLIRTQEATWSVVIFISAPISLSRTFRLLWLNEISLGRNIILHCDQIERNPHVCKQVYKYTARAKNNMRARLPWPTVVDIPSGWKSGKVDIIFWVRSQFSCRL